MTTLKEWMDQQWQAKGVRCANHGTAWLGDDVHSIHFRAGTTRNYKSKEQKAYEARFAIYNKKLVPIILAEATKSDASYMVMGDNKLPGPIYRWERVQSPAEAAPEPVVTSVPRKRVSHKKVAQAAAILERVPEQELTAFLARFGLSLSLAASIASLDNVEQIARQFLRATL